MPGMDADSTLSQVVGDGFFPFRALSGVCLRHFSDVSVHGRVEGGAFVHDPYAGGCRVDGGQLDVDAGGQLAVDDVGVGRVAGLGVEGGVDPGGVVMAVTDAKDGSLDILRGLGVEELRVPVRTGPGALAFGSEEREGYGLGGVDGEGEFTFCVGHGVVP